MTPKQTKHESSKNEDGDGVDSDPRYLEELSFISNAARARAQAQSQAQAKAKARVKKEEEKSNTKTDVDEVVCITAAMRSHANKKSQVREGRESKRVKKEDANAKSGGVKRELKISLFTTVVGLAISSVAFLSLSYLYLRIGLKAFCPYDEDLGAFIVMEKVYTCPERVEVEDGEDDDDDEVCLSFFKDVVEEPMELLREVPVPDRGFHELLCRGTFNVLSMGASLLHPRIIHYDTTIPRTEVKSPCPELPPRERKKPVEKSMMKKSWKAIRCMLGIRKPNTLSKKEKATAANIKSSSSFKTDTSYENDDWTALISVPPSLNLSTKQIILLRKVKEALKLRIDGDDSSEENWLDRLNGVPFGGRFPFWFPLKDKWGVDGEDSGSRSITSFMNIMHWPENLITNFPGSGICANGCPADFAIYNTLRFREEYQPWKMTSSASEANKVGWMYVRGYSPTRYDDDPSAGGSSILWYQPGLYKMQDPESYSRVILNSLEICISDALIRSGGHIAKCNVVLNCDGFGISMIPPIAATKRILKLMQDNYPDKLGVFVIANIAGASQMFLKIVLPLLPAVVRQKIHLLPNDGAKRTAMMKELVHEQFIPKHFGGTDGYKYNADEYYKSGDYKIEFMSDEEGINYYDTIPYYAP